MTVAGAEAFDASSNVTDLWKGYVENILLQTKAFLARLYHYIGLALSDIWK